MNDVISPQTLRLLSLAMLKGIGPAALKKVAAIDGFELMSIKELSDVVAPVARVLEVEPDSSWTSAQNAADMQVNAAKKHRARILSPLDPDYPRLLAATRDDPFLLYIIGMMAKVPEKSVAIIGTREPTPSGTIIAKRVTAAFCEQNWSVVSGLALGCDAIAHQAALESKSHTVAVLAHGLHMISPSRHKELAYAILDGGGALVSEYPFGHGAQSQQFVKRDRTQAGLAQGVVMIQSDIKGGSLHASRAALDYERWLAVPYPTPKDVQRRETKVQGNLVIADGARQEKLALLRCPETALERVLILRDRVDILRLAGAEREDVRENIGALSGEQAGTDEKSGSGGAHFHETIETGASPAEPLSSPLHNAHFHVAVNALDHGSDLVVSQVPSWRLLEFQQTPFRASRDHDVIVVLAVRLQHLQDRLDEVKKFRASMTQAYNETQALHLQFSVEDILLHMKRSVDDLTRLDSFKKMPALVEVPANEPASQLTLLDQKVPYHRKQVDLVAALNQIVRSLPKSVAVSSVWDAPSAVTHTGSVVEVSIEDLVHSFNTFVTTVLADDLKSDSSLAN